MLNVDFEIEAVNLIESPHILISGLTDEARPGVLRSIAGAFLRQMTPTPVSAHYVAGPKPNTLLGAMVKALEYRQSLLEEARSKHIDAFNARLDNNDELLHRTLVIVEEISNLDTESHHYLTVLTAQGRPVGIHVVLCTRETEVSRKLLPARIMTSIGTRIACKTP